MEYSFCPGGELGDVVRANGSAKQAPPPAPPRQDQDYNNFSSWPFPSSSSDLHYQEPTTGNNSYDCFGTNYPFVTNNNELLQEIICGPPTTSFFTGDDDNSDNIRPSTTWDGKGVQASDDDDCIFAEMIRNSLSRITTTTTGKANNINKSSIETTYGPAVLSPPPREAPFLSGDMIINEGSTVRVSSPPQNYNYSSSAKRRKKEAKKVICIPAPPPSNGNKTSGEAVPPDLWAWRKYGQKPIKGSPYPRGYYRCSSSKGCPARKQVEKSRSDPNMLVITYTCEHNHAWPTQRNALAGSTRAQPNVVPSKTKTKTNHAPSSDPKPSTSNSQMKKKVYLNNNQGSSNKVTTVDVKEEERIVGIIDDQPIMSVDDGIQVSDDQMTTMAPESNRFSSEDFFAELGEFESNSSIDDLLQNPGTRRESTGNECKAVDPIFSFLDWSSGT